MTSKKMIFEKEVFYNILCGCRFAVGGIGLMLLKFFRRGFPIVYRELTLYPIHLLHWPGTSNPSASASKLCLWALNHQCSNEALSLM